MFPVRRSRKTSLGVTLVVTAMLLSGCDLLRSAPEEVFYFRYQLVEPDRPRPSGVVYSVASTRTQDCGPFPMRLEDVARAVQQIGGDLDYRRLYDCSSLYTIGNTAAQLRADPTTPFEVDLRRDDGVQVVVRRVLVSGVSQNPTLINLVVNSGAVVDQRTNNGFGTIEFGSSGPVFRCESGNYPWHANISNVNFDTFFEFELDTRNADYVGGKFACLARNQDDSSDKRLLIIMGGRFSMKNL